MPIKRFKPEQIVTLRGQIEVEIANETTPKACKDAAVRGTILKQQISKPILHHSQIESVRHGHADDLHRPRRLVA